jgi:malonyl-CoA/methylmalonyl-CoA synthetase
MLFPHLAASLHHESSAGARVRIRDRTMTYPELAAAALAVSAELPVGVRVAVLAERELETVVAIVAALVRGTTVVPVNPSASPRELEHQLGDSEPQQLLLRAATAASMADDPRGAGPLGALPRHVVDLAGPATYTAAATAGWPAPPDPEMAALVMYTSGTTGPPKGAVLSHRAVAANLDMLAEVWAWTAADTLVHALPLYHVHGLVLGVLGALRVGSGLHHLGDFAADATADALRAGGTMHFGVPTIYHRLADAASDPDIAAALAGARLLVSGSAGLPAPVHERVRELTGHTIVERYGMTETMITTAVPAGVTDKAGTVGPALPGVELRVVDDRGADVPADGEAMGEVLVRTPALFSGYLGSADPAPTIDDWFRTGDTATIDADRYVRIVGRSSVDIIKSGGFKIGAGEIEDVLLEHPAVAEAAVRGVADDELGERVVAWVVLRADADPATTPEVLVAHTRDQLSRHKQPRAVVIVDALPRNDMGKVQKSRLESPG